ncbi:uncharacterized protein LOC128545932 isoform X1 [Mercenaria mercenaria]|uniref:uncharacterized protein LOC128545932 isoform X1 n=1 Tax=Mercenaria mercenaria TaxID=6596 RepID=UPI00234F15A0|nr:uncharacterized protein LOC128545932 isoform X1 [Mercenaria mercenaria]
MDAKMSFKVFKVVVFFLPISTALRILVTKDQCGRPVDLTVEKVLYLDYEGADLGDILSLCLINVTNYNDRDMICIQSEGAYFDMDCAMHLKYHIRGWKPYSYEKDYTCSDFHSKPLCDRNSVSAVEFRYAYLQQDVAVHVKLFTKKYVETTTRRYTTTWSSWTSWSSDYDDNDDNSNSVGTVVGVIVGIFIFLVIVISCVCAKAGQSSAPKPQYVAPTVVQYHSQAQQGNQFANQTHDSANQAINPQQYPAPNQPGILPQQQYTPNPSAYAGYQVHNPVYQQVQMAGDQPSLTPQAYDQPPSEPPPPYPGY